MYAFLRLEQQCDRDSPIHLQEIMVLSKSVITFCAQFFCSMVAATYAHAIVDPVPYIIFMGEQLPNHSFVDLHQFGNTINGTNVLQCHTDLDVLTYTTTPDSGYFQMELYFVVWTSIV